jgi:hypothetical protein
VRHYDAFETYYYESAAACSTHNRAKGDPARVSLWEVHPIYKFEVCENGDCSSGSGWVPLEQWKQ